MEDLQLLLKNHLIKTSFKKTLENMVVMLEKIKGVVYPKSIDSHTKNLHPNKIG